MCLPSMRNAAPLRPRASGRAGEAAWSSSGCLFCDGLTARRSSVAQRAPPLPGIRRVVRLGLQARRRGDGQSRGVRCGRCEARHRRGSVCVCATMALAGLFHFVEATRVWRKRGSVVGCLQQAGLKAEDLNKISRRPGGRFNVIQCAPVRPLEDSLTESCDQQTQSRREVVARYIIPSDPGVVLTLRQRKDSGIDLSDFISSQKHDTDSTGLVCMWPAEEIMTYYCISRPELFRNKRVIELGSGYGLAGLAIAACSEASEVLLTDGNPQVVEYIRRNITQNSGQFGDTKVRTCALHWSRHQAAMPGLNFDLVIAADCTFFKGFHVDLAHTIKGLLSTREGCQAILFNPRRGDSLDRFVRACQSVELDVEIQEQYDSRVWDLHQGFARNEAGTEWPNYDEDHCYPLFLSITHEQPSMVEAL